MFFSAFKSKKKNNKTERDLTRTLHKNMSFQAKEQYKMLRANLAFVLPEPTPGKAAVIGITSPDRNEGKSTTSINLSYVLAEDGKKVLLVDADLRLPSIAKKLGLRKSPGLTNMLKDSNENAIIESEIQPGWHMLFSGSTPPNPSELLGSERMEKLINIFSKDYDYIVLDLPPVNIVSDALTVARMLSGIIVVVRENSTEKREFEACVRRLELANIKILGCVLNGVTSNSTFYSKYNKYRYKYSYRYGKSFSSDSIDK